MDAYDIHAEWDEDGCYLCIHTEEAVTRYRVTDPERLYDGIKAAILPWLMERDGARREYNERLLLARDVLADVADAFRCDPDESGGLDEHWHSVRADLYDNREGK